MQGTIDTTAILNGALFGLCATIVGWVKNGGALSGFQARGLILKMPLGIIIGAVAALKGIPFSDASVWAAGVGLVTVADGIIKAIVRRFIPGWLDLVEPPPVNPLESKPPAPPAAPLPPVILVLVLALPFLSCGCFDSPPEVMKGHDQAALCVQRAAQNYQTAVDGMAQALAEERRARVGYALQKAMDNVRLEAAKTGGQIDAEKTLKYLQAAYDARDKELSAMQAVIDKFRASAATGDREAALALSLMGELRKYDAAGVNPEKVISEASSIFAVPIPKPEDFPAK